MIPLTALLACAPSVRFVRAGGEAEDLTEALARSDGVLELDGDGVLELAAGEYLGRIEVVSGSVVIEAEPGATWLVGPYDEDLLFGSRVRVRPGATLEVRGLGVRGGAAHDGAAFDVRGGTLRLHDVHLESNVAEDDGGAIHAEEAVVEVTDSVLTGNTADSGGAVYTRDSDLTFTGTEISFNGATEGGGMRLFGGDADLEAVTVEANQAVDRGAGLSFEWEIVGVVRDSSVVGNSAASRGGGLWVDDNALVIVHGGELRANSAAWGGGAQVRDSGVLTLQEAEVRDNHADEGGGVHVHDEGVLQSLRSTWSANSPEDVVLDCGAELGEVTDDFVMDNETCTCT